MPWASISRSISSSSWSYSACSSASKGMTWADIALGEVLGELSACPVQPQGLPAVPGDVLADRAELPQPGAQGLPASRRQLADDLVTKTDCPVRPMLRLVAPPVCRSYRDRLNVPSSPILANCRDRGCRLPDPHNRRWWPDRLLQIVFRCGRALPPPGAKSVRLRIQPLVQHIGRADGEY